MVDLIGSAADLTGGIGGFNIGSIMVILGVIVLAALLGGAGAWFIASQIQWKYKIKVYSKVMGKLQRTGLDKAKIIRLGKAGDEVLVTKKSKKILPMPTLQAEPKTYWFEKRSDGEWINIEPRSIEDSSSGKREVAMHYLDKEMRYARGALGYMSKERYDQTTFMQKYGGMIAYSVLILVTAIGMWLIVGRMIDVVGSISSAMNTAEAVLEESKRILGIIDTMQGGAGYSPA